jgi:hypothetical protein
MAWERGRGAAAAAEWLQTGRSPASPDGARHYGTPTTLRSPVCPPLRCSLVVRVAQGGRAWLCARVVVRKDQGLIRLVRLGPIAPNFPRVLVLHSGTHCSVLGATQSGVG